MGKKITEDGLVLNPPTKWGQQTKLTEEEKARNAELRKSLGYGGQYLIAAENPEGEAEVVNVCNSGMWAAEIASRIETAGCKAYVYVWRDEAGGYAPWGLEACLFARRHGWERIRNGEGPWA